MKKETIKITGMTCAACAARVEKVVSKMAGITSASVNFATESLSVEYDEGVASRQKINEVIEKAGYGTVEISTISEVTIPIGGMTCASCSARVEKVLGKLEGITSATVNLATEKATVHYDTQQIKLSTIRQAIEKAGYQALEIEKKTAIDEDKLRKEKEIRTLKTKLIVSATFGIPLLYLAMGAMIWWLRLPIPSFLEPMQYPLTYAIVQIILVIPIIIAGHRFYSVGFKAIIQRSPNMDSLIAMGTSAAILYSLYSVYQISIGNFGAVEDLYFETAGVIITLILLGKYLEAVSKGKTSEAIKKLMGLAPKTALVIRDGVEIETPID
ncbi:heavy metal translocating P-type ATPase, partial [Acetobacterium sp. UBA5834]